MRKVAPATRCQTNAAAAEDSPSLYTAHLKRVHVGVGGSHYPLPRHPCWLVPRIQLVEEERVVSTHRVLQHQLQRACSETGQGKERRRREGGRKTLSRSTESLLALCGDTCSRQMLAAQDLLPVLMLFTVPAAAANLSTRTSQLLAAHSGLVRPQLQGHACLLKDGQQLLGAAQLYHRLRGVGS